SDPSWIRSFQGRAGKPQGGRFPLGRRGGGSTRTVGANGADRRVHEPHKGASPALPSPLTRGADADLRKSRPAPPCAQNSRLLDAYPGCFTASPNSLKRATKQASGGCSKRVRRWMTST